VKVVIEEVLQSNHHQEEDKQALGSLLRLAVASADGNASLNLDNNEELPRLIPVLVAHFSQEELAKLAGKQLAARMFEMYRTETLQNLFLEAELQRVLRAFHEADIAIVLFKGPALAYTVYPQPQQRTYHDLDMLIHEDDLPRARDLLADMGYTFYEEFRSNVTNGRRRGYNFTLKPADSWLEVLIELHTAPHDSDIGMDFDVVALWASAQPIMVLGAPALTMHPVDHLLYLCWHYRFHSFSRLLWLYDLVMIVRSGGDYFDWDMLVERARRQKLATTVYYCLTWCHDLFGVAIPERVWIALKPPALCRLIVERFALPDAARALATRQGYMHRVLAHHMMVDHAGELLKVGLRTLFPSRAAIGQRYMEHSRLPLKWYFLFYLVHPWVTLAKGIRYVARKEETA
jgi:hypothetical protein